MQGWFYWRLVKVILVVAFDFLPKNFVRRWGPMNDTFALIWIEVEVWGHFWVMGTFISYLLFKKWLLAFTGAKDVKKLWAPVLLPGYGLIPTCCLKNGCWHSQVPRM